MHVFNFSLRISISGDCSEWRRTKSPACCLVIANVTFSLLVCSEKHLSEQSGKGFLGRLWQKCGVSIIINNSVPAAGGVGKFQADSCQIHLAQPFWVEICDPVLMQAYKSQTSKRILFSFLNHAWAEIWFSIRLPTRQPLTQLVNKENSFSPGQMEEDSNRRARLHLRGWDLRPH